MSNNNTILVFEDTTKPNTDVFVNKNTAHSLDPMEQYLNYIQYGYDLLDYSGGGEEPLKPLTPPKKPTKPIEKSTKEWWLAAATMLFWDFI